MITTRRFTNALVYASNIHSQQRRKGTKIPYIAHLLGVTSIVLENGGNESEAIGALLHDAAEDQGGLETLREIRRRFGAPVARIVEGCTDTFEDPKPAWKPRKIAYLKHLETATKSVLLVSAADKLYNARAILADYQEIGDDLWSRFAAKSQKENLWYYESLVVAYKSNRKSPKRICEELETTIKELRDLIP